MVIRQACSLPFFVMNKIIQILIFGILKNTQTIFLNSLIFLFLFLQKLQFFKQIPQFFIINYSQENFSENVDLLYNYYINHM